MIKIVIESNDVRTRSGNKNGRDWTIKSQNCLMQLNGETRRVDIMLEPDQAPFPSGQYLWDPERSLYFDRQGNLAVSRRFDLIPVSKPQAVEKVA